MSGEFGKNHQDHSRYQEFVKELNLTGITKSPAKHLLLYRKSELDFVVSSICFVGFFLFFQKKLQIWLYKPLLLVG